MSATSRSVEPRAGGVRFFGPTDLLQMDAHALPGATMKHDSPQSPESRLIGGPIQENKDKVARVNPITYVTPDDPPFLIVHGDPRPTRAASSERAAV